MVLTTCLKTYSRLVYRINVRVHKEGKEGEDAGHDQKSTLDVRKVALKTLVNTYP